METLTLHPATTGTVFGLRAELERPPRCSRGANRIFVDERTRRDSQARGQHSRN